jgi:purine-binding chemotaxis protein CheW
MIKDKLNEMISEIDQSEDVVNNQYLTFSLGDEEYGINIKDITEIIGIQSITHLPNTLDYVKGVINLRGQVHPLIDTRLRFEMDEREHDERTCIIVVNIDEYKVGLIVDTVSEVLEISNDKIDSPPQIIKNTTQDFIKGLGRVEDQVKIILDTKKVLYGVDIESINEVA